MASVSYRSRKYILLLGAFLLLGSRVSSAQEAPKPASSWNISSLINTTLICAPTVLEIGGQIGSLTTDYQQSLFGTEDVSEETIATVQYIFSHLHVDSTSIVIKKLNPELRTSDFYKKNFGVYATNTTLFIDEEKLNDFPHLTHYLVEQAAYKNFYHHAYRNTGLFGMGLTASKALGMYYLMRWGTQGLQSTTQAIGWNAYTDSSHFGMSVVRFMLNNIAMPMLMSSVVNKVGSLTTNLFLKTQEHSLYCDATNKDKIIFVLQDLFDYAAHYPDMQDSAYTFIQQIMTTALQYNKIQHWNGLLQSYRLTEEYADLSEQKKHALAAVEQYLQSI